MTDKEIHIEQLMIEKLTGVIGEEDNLYLEDLLQHDTGARDQWRRIKTTFAESGAEHYLDNLDQQAAWQHVTTGIARKKHLRINRRRRIMLAASLLLLLFAVGVVFYYSWSSAGVTPDRLPDNSVKLFVGGSRTVNLSQYKVSSKLSLSHTVNLHVGKGSLSYAPVNGEVSNALNTLVIPPTAFYKIRLSDGTDISLNSMSELKFAFTFSGGKREVWLNGEAYFKVAKDTHRPFIVHTPLTDITVLGTEFNVNTYDSLKVKTALVEGAVNTSGGDGENILLKPGHEAVFSKGHGFDVKTFNGDDILSWMQGVYYFRGASLKDIATVIHRWYGDTLIFDAPEVSSSRFTGAMLKDKPLKEFLENLAYTSNIHYYTKGGRIHVDTKSLR